MFTYNRILSKRMKEINIILHLNQIKIITLLHDLYNVMNKKNFIREISKISNIYVKIEFTFLKML